MKKTMFFIFLIISILFAGCSNEETGKKEDNDLDNVADSQEFESINDHEESDGDDGFEDFDENEIDDNNETPDEESDTESDYPEKIEVEDGSPFYSPEDIGFFEVDGLSNGEWILFNSWAVQNALMAYSPETKETRTVFYANRVWSFGAGGNGDIYFSSVDPKMEENWAIPVNDAIQYTWHYKTGKKPVQLTSGRINDESHVPSVDGKKLYFSRRSNFYYEYSEETGLIFENDFWRIVEYDMETKDEYYLTEHSNNEFADLYPAPCSDGTILFNRRLATGGNSIMRLFPDSGKLKTEVESAAIPSSTSDGKKVIYLWNNGIYLSDCSDLSKAEIVLPIKVATTVFALSPDKNKIAYRKRSSEQSSCEDIFIYDIDEKSEEKIVDCNETGIWATDISWIRVE